MKLRLLPFALIVCSTSFGATSVNRNGITWEFDRDYPTGQFANGDWWVVGPVQVVRITPVDPDPADSVDLNGSMINPKPNTPQGYNSAIPFQSMTYSRTANVARSLPLTIAAGSSLVSSISATTESKVLSRAYGVLTVLNAPAPAGSFRPALYGADKTVPGNVSQIPWERFRSLAPVANTPALADVRATWGWPYVQHYTYWLNTHVIHQQYPPYGREITNHVGQAALMLNLDFPRAAKEPLAIDFLQMGIDLMGFVREGGSFEADGGHGIGRKLPMLLAAVTFGDAALVKAAGGPAGKFQEDSQTFFVGPEDVGRPLAGGEPYTAAQVGMPEWGIRHRTRPSADNSLLKAPYRDVVGPALFGVALGAMMMDLREEWDWEPFFGYVDRYRVILGPAHDKFIAGMWTTYRPLFDPPRPPTGIRIE